MFDINKFRNYRIPDPDDNIDTVTYKERKPITGKEAQQSFYPGLTEADLIKLNNEVAQNRYNKLKPKLKNEAAFSNFRDNLNPSMDWTTPINIREYAPAPNKSRERIRNKINATIGKFKSTITGRPNFDSRAADLDAVSFGNNAFYLSIPNPRISIPQRNPKLEPYGMDALRKAYAFNKPRSYFPASLGLMSSSELKHFFDKNGLSKEVLQVLYNRRGDPNTPFRTGFYHELGHAADDLSRNALYLLYFDKDNFNRIQSLMGGGPNVSKSKAPYLSYPMELLNGISSTARALRSNNKIFKGFVPSPGDATDVNNFKQFFNMNPHQMGRFLNKVDRAKLDPAVRLWGTLRMLNDEKKKQEIIDLISKQVLPYVAKNNTKSLSSNYRLWA